VSVPRAASSPSTVAVALPRPIGPRTVSRIYEICGGDPLPMWGDDHRLPQHVRVQAPVEDEDAAWEGAAPSRYGRRP
jgi:hypothetical protein